MADNLGFRGGLRVEFANDSAVVSRDAVDSSTFPQFKKLPVEMQTEIW